VAPPCRPFVIVRLFLDEPKTVGDYICAVARGRDRKGIELDWLHAQAITGSAPGELARRLHACRALASVPRLGKAMTAELCDAVTNERLPAALRSWSAIAWAHGDGWKPGKAVDMAVDGTQNLEVRRALVVGLGRRGVSDTPKAKVWSEKLLRVESDLAPTVAWAAAPKQILATSLH